jgi:hypothetical protein
MKMGSASKKTSLNKGFFMSSCFYSKPQGNMAEYILPVAMIGLVAIGGLTWLWQGNQAETAIMRGAQGERLTKNQSGQTALVSKQFGQNPNDGTLRYQLPNGKWIELQNVPMNPALSVEVDGVNGTTNKMLAVIEQIIAQLEKSGGDPDAINALKTLATQGYAIAGAEKRVEELLAQCGKDKQCVHQSIWLNPENAKIASNLLIDSCASFLQPKCDFADVERKGRTALSPLAWEGMSILDPRIEQESLQSEVYDFKKENVTVGKSMHGFLEAFASANQKETGSDGLNQLVQDLSRQILIISSAAGHTTSMSGIGSSYHDVKTNAVNVMGSHPDVTPDQFAELVKSQLATLPLPSYSDQTTVRSDVICQTGQGSREGQLCR